MKIEKGMKFKGNFNGACFEILEVNEKITITTTKILATISKKRKCARTE